MFNVLGSAILFIGILFFLCDRNYSINIKKKTSKIHVKSASFDLEGDEVNNIYYVKYLECINNTEDDSEKNEDNIHGPNTFDNLKVVIKNPTEMNADTQNQSQQQKSVSAENEKLIYHQNVDSKNNLRNSKSWHHFMHKAHLSPVAINPTIGIDPQRDNIRPATTRRRLELLIGKLGSTIEGARGTQLGSSVSMSENGLIVASGAPWGSENGNSAGHIIVSRYSHDTKTWEQLGNTILGGAAGDLFGFYISMSGDGMIIAVGSPYNDGNGESSGYVRVFQYSNATKTWEQVRNTIEGAATRALFGLHISMSKDGDIVAVGSVNRYDNGDEIGNIKMFNILMKPGNGNNLEILLWVQNQVIISILSRYLEMEK